MHVRSYKSKTPVNMQIPARHPRSRSARFLFWLCALLFTCAWFAYSTPSASSPQSIDIENGAAGDDGDSGSQGTAGTEGDNGTTAGTDGTDGTNGTAGRQWLGRFLCKLDLRFSQRQHKRRSHSHRRRRWRGRSRAAQEAGEAMAASVAEVMRDDPNPNGGLGGDGGDGGAAGRRSPGWRRRRG